MRGLRLRGSAWLIASTPLLVAATPATPATPVTPVTLVVHVASADGSPVATDAWIDARIADATRVFAGAAVRFVRGASPATESIPAEVMTVTHRHALAAHVPQGGSVHVFVVAKLADKDRGGQFISGVHWRYAGGHRHLRGRRYVILSRASRDSTLAHELGHFFGLPHSKAPRLLMTTPWRLPSARLSDRQLRRIRRNVARFVDARPRSSRRTRDHRRTHRVRRMPLPDRAGTRR